MTLTYFIVGGSQPQALTHCGSETCNQSFVKCTQTTQSLEVLRGDKQLLLASTSSKRSLFKGRILYTVLCCPLIRSVSFVPTQPETSQVQYVHKGLALPSLSFQPFIHESSVAYRKLYTGEEWEVNDPALKEAMTLILNNFLLDTKTTNLAVTFTDGPNPPATWYWVKV